MTASSDEKLDSANKHQDTEQGALEPSLLEEAWRGVRWVRIMCDFTAEPVWNISGENCELEDLPISSVLAQHLLEWAGQFDDLAPTSDDVSPDWNVDQFSQTGLMLAREVKRQLPDWTVIYFDEAKACTGRDGAPQGPFEHEITL